MTVAAAAELVDLPELGRRFVGAAEVRLGDTDASGALRFDALARHLQDVANDDAVDSGIDGAFGWVVRRTMIEVRHAAVLGERLALTTFCSGTGRSWAERRTSIAGDRGAAIEAVSVWVQVDPTTGRPAPLGADFHAAYDTAARGRRISARLSLPAPPDGASVRPWTVRAADLDVFAHVNNAVHWAIVEELVARCGGPRTGTAELEHLLAVDLDSPVTLHLADRPSPSAWLVDDSVTGMRSVHTAARWRR
jgi:acyl-ACP thioesterase